MSTARKKHRGSASQDLHASHLSTPVAASSSSRTATLDTPSIATTPFNSPIFHPEYYPTNGIIPATIDFASLFPAATQNLHTYAHHHSLSTPYLGNTTIPPHFASTQLHPLPQVTPYHHPYQPTSYAPAPSLQHPAMHTPHPSTQMGVQAVYATPAAWAKHRQFLLNQPTPKALPAATNTGVRIRNMMATPTANGTHTRTLSASPDYQFPTSFPTPSRSTTSTAMKHQHKRSFSSFTDGSSVSSNASAAPTTSSTGKPKTTKSAINTDSSSTSAAASSKLAHIQASLRHLKQLQLLHEEERAMAVQKSRIQRTFLSLSSFLIVVFVGVLCYYNYLILSPHLHALFWAFLFWVVLDTPQRLLLAAFTWIDSVVLDRYSKKIEGFICLLTILTGFYFRTSLSSLLVIGLIFVILTFFLFGNRHVVTSILLLVILLLIIAFPLFLFTKTCVEESQEIALRLRSFIESNKEFQHLLDDFSTSSTFRSIEAYVRSWGYDLPKTNVETLRDMILKSLVQFTDQITTILTSLYGLINNLSNLLVSLVTFASILYFLLVTNRDFNGTLTWLSPFSADDNTKLIHTMKRSVVSIFLCSFSIGFIHIVVTYISFSLCGIDLCLILSFISGFAAMLPIFSSWIVWLPACLGLLFTGQTLSAVILCMIQLTLLFYVDVWIYSNVPGNSYVIGLSIVFAVYTFGASGVLVGPLLASTSLTFLSIYKDYISMPSMIPTPMPNNGMPTMNDYQQHMANVAAAAAAANANGHGHVNGHSNDSTVSSGTLVEPSNFRSNQPQASPTPTLRHRKTVEIGSLSTAHSSSTLNHLAADLQAIADAQPSSSCSEATTPASSARDASPSPLARSRSEESPISARSSSSTPNIVRALRFTTPAHSAAKTMPQQRTPLTPLITNSILPPSSSMRQSSAPMVSSAIVEGNEYDEEHEEAAAGGYDFEETNIPQSQSTMYEDTTPLPLDSSPDDENDAASPFDPTSYHLQATHEELLQQYEIELEHANRLHQLENQHLQEQEEQREQELEEAEDDEIIDEEVHSNEATPTAAGEPIHLTVQDEHGHETHIDDEDEPEPVPQELRLPLRNRHTPVTKSPNTKR